MQQTSKYQFKLIEGTDDFSPTPLNDNMEKVEEALEGLTDDFLARVGAGGSTCRIQYGSYTGTGTSGSGNRTSLTFDFYPVLVIIADGSNGNSPRCVMVRGGAGAPSTASGYYVSQIWTDNGVSWSGSYDANSQMNTSGRTYYYVALGYSQ